MSELAERLNPRPLAADGGPPAGRWPALDAAAYAATAEHLSQGLTLTSPQGELVLCNRRFRRLWRLPERLCQPGTPWRDLLAASPGAQLLVDEALPPIGPGQPARHQREWLLHDARTLAMASVVLPGGLTLGLHDDVTDLRWTQQQAALRGHHRTATGLPEAPVLGWALRSALARNPPGQEIALLRIDARPLAAAAGGAASTLPGPLLRQLAERLRQATRESDTCVHLGAGSFAVLQTGTSQPAGSMALGQRLLQTLMQPWAGAGQRCAVGASIGVAVAPFDADDSEALLACSERALQAALAAGPGQCRHHEPPA